MTNTTDIDWSKAPEDAEFYCTDNFMWYKVRRHSLYMSEGVGDNWDESCLTVDDMKNNLSFIPRPVQQTIQQAVQGSVQMNKPPIGLMPKSIWIEQMQVQRRNEITAAMQRFIEAGKDIPNDWLQELIELNNVIQNIQPEAALAKAEPIWVEWGKNEKPIIAQDVILEYKYIDGDLRTGTVDDWTWNETGRITDNHTVARYRILGEEGE